LARRRASDRSAAPVPEQKLEPRALAPPPVEAPLAAVAVAAAAAAAAAAELAVLAEQAVAWEAGRPTRL
jgi:hypothetical protein